eukprot:718567-Hanusia_phi.AAC.2
MRRSEMISSSGSVAAAPGIRNRRGRGFVKKTGDHTRFSETLVLVYRYKLLLLPFGRAKTKQLQTYREVEGNLMSLRCRPLGRCSEIALITV